MVVFVSEENDILLTKEYVSVFPGALTVVENSDPEYPPKNHPKSFVSAEPEKLALPVSKFNLNPVALVSEEKIYLNIDDDERPIGAPIPPAK
jgi:hypothetical protein